ncbi:MAG TPA: hypothetical protein VGD67_14285 [Pseudonocardiaceae bacterium]
MIVRRVLLAGVLVVAAVGCGGPTEGGTAAPVTAAQGTSTEETAADDTADDTADDGEDQGGSAEEAADTVLGPAGWGPLTLRMDLATARDTGLFLETPDPEPGACVSWSTPEAVPVEAVVSADLGLMALLVKEERVLLSTPEGVGLGDAAEDVALAYPKFAVADAQMANGALIQTPDDPTAVYRMQFGEDDVLHGMTLEAREQHCYG